MSKEGQAGQRPVYYHHRCRLQPVREEKYGKRRPIKQRVYRTKVRRVS